MIMNSVRRVLRTVLCLLFCFEWACPSTRADFAANYEVKGKDNLVEVLMSRFRELKEHGEVFTTLNRDTDGLSQLVLMRMENRLPVIYVMVLHEHSSDHGENSELPQFLTEFPLKTRVVNPIVSYTLDVSRVSEPAGSAASNVSMISSCVKQTGTNKITYAESYLRFEFRKEERLIHYLQSIVPLLLDKKLGENKLYVSSTRETNICGEPPPPDPQP